MSTIAVVGGGIAGLTAAYRLSATHDVVVFESAAVPGGKIHSQHVDGFVFDWGPNGFLSNAAELRALIGEIGLDAEFAEAGTAASRRFIYWGGKLHALPAKPQAALAFTLLSPFGKLRALADLRATPPAGGATDTESVFAFMRRHFGREVAERLVAPALLGITGGDAATTSLTALFPRLREMENASGSVIRGMMRSRAKPGRLSGFGAGGMQRLTDRLAERLGERVRCGAAVQRVARLERGWHIDAGGTETTVDGVVLATPAFVSAGFADGFDPALAEQLRRIPYAPMRVAGIAFRRDDLPAPLDGFGFLAARGQGVRILGGIYTSALFPGQAPDGTAYIRVFLGGATDPDAAGLDAESAQRLVRADLARTLGITAAPIAYHEATWPQAIPQYSLEHPAIVRTIGALAARHRGFALAGNAYRGLGIGDNVREALAVAERIGAELR